MNLPNLPESIHENPFRISRLNHSADFRPDWDVESLNSVQSNWVLNEIRRNSGRKMPDPGQLIPILLSQPGYGKTHILGRLSYALKEIAVFVFVGQIPDTRRISDHIRYTVVETLFRSDDQSPTPLEQALAALLHPSMLQYAKYYEQDRAKHRALTELLESPMCGTLEVLTRSSSLESFQKLAKSMAARLPHLRGSVLRAMALSLSPEKHLARQWLRGEKLSEDDARRINLLEESPSTIDVLTAIVGVLEFRKPLVICFDQIESVLKDSDGPRLLGTELMELLAAVPNQHLIVSCFQQAWFGNYRPLLPPAFIRRAKELELDFPAPEHALALVKQRLETWPGHKTRPGEYFPFDSAKLEMFARDEKPRPAELIQLCEAAMDGWMKGRLKAPLVVTPGVVPDESLSQLFQKRWLEELAAAQHDPRRQIEEMSDARIFVAMKEAVALLKSAGEQSPLHINLVKENVLASTPSYTRYGMRIEFKEGTGKYSIIAGVTTMTGGNGLFYYVREFDKAVKTSRGGILLHPRRDFNLGQVGSALIKKARALGKLEILSIKEHRDMFVAMECALGLIEQAQTGNLSLGATTVNYEQCQELMREAGVLKELAFLQKLASWSAPAAKATTGTPDNPVEIQESTESSQLVAT